MRDARPFLIFLLAFLAFAHFTQPETHNVQQYTRLALTVSILEGHIDIDRYARAYPRADLSYFKDHYYADKVPGLSLLALPSVAGTRMVLGLLGRPTDMLDGGAFVTYTIAATLGTVAILGALAVVACFGVARRLGASENRASVATFILCLGTPFFGWSTTLFAHVPAGAMLILSLWAALALRERQTAGWPELGFGVLLGLALVIEVAIAPAIVLIGVLALLQRRVRVMRWLAVGLGGAIGLLPLLVNNWLAFGSPLDLGYSHVVGFEGMQEGFFGIRPPDLAVANALLFGFQRGLIPLSPILLFVPVGLIAMWKKGLKGPMLVITVAALVGWAINAGYFYWHGGYSTGPRHLVAILPLIAVSLAFVDLPTTTDKMVATALTTVSLVFSVMCAEVSMFAPADYLVTIRDFVLAKFIDPLELLHATPIIVLWSGFIWLLMQPAGAISLSARPRTASPSGRRAHRSAGSGS
jgi:4-amino-4-deoxy-L-arabinose transferase-like glycosyltransferase